MSQSLFGSEFRTDILLVVSMLEETHVRELARVFERSTLQIMRVVDRFELEGVLVSRKLGIERRICLNPRYVAHRELLALLEQLSRSRVDLQEKLAAERRRPRRRGKPL